jgi:predicted N-acyltransferase
VREAGSVDDVRRWHPLYLDVMRHHMVPARSLRFFETLWEELATRGMARLWLAEHDGRLLAGALNTMLGATVFYQFNGVRRDAFALRPNDVLQWEAIHAAAAEGYRHYDLGEVVEHDRSLADFKRKWGTEARRLHRYYHPAPPEPPERRTGDRDEDDGEELGGPGLAVRAWQRMPLPVTAVAGDTILRYL